MPLICELSCLLHIPGHHSERQPSMTWPNSLKGAAAVNVGPGPRGLTQLPPHPPLNHLDTTSASDRK